jgi:hypothetical protein
VRLGIPPLAAFLLVALVGLNAWLIKFAVGEMQPIVPAPAAAAHASTGTPSTPSVTELEQKPLAAVSEILAHPVFFKTRTPYVPVPPPASANARATPAVITPDPVLMVTGIVITDRLKKAYLLKQNEAQGIWVTEGETVLGWTVETIYPKGIALKQSNRTIEFSLYPSK